MTEKQIDRLFVNAEKLINKILVQQEKETYFGSKRERNNNIKLDIYLDKINELGLFEEFKEFIGLC